MGSGDWQVRTKPYTSEFISLDINQLKRWGCLEPGVKAFLSYSNSKTLQIRAFSDHLDLVLSSGTTDSIPMVWKAQNFGGKRPWFTCPKCDRGAVKLYLKWNTHFICRKCANAKYLSQNLVKYQRHHRNRRKLEKIITDAGGNLVFKPKHMHWKTYSRLIRKIQLEKDQIAFAVCGL